MTFAPETLFSKFAFCMRVFTTSRGAATVIDATAPAIDATKFTPIEVLVGVLGFAEEVERGEGFESGVPIRRSLVKAEAPKS